MKKDFSLDYEIYSDTERVKAVDEILKNLNINPSSRDLELMANYILYGKDKDDKNAIQRKETFEEKKRYSTFKKMSEKMESLDIILTNPLTNQAGFKPITEKYVYKKPKPKIKRPYKDDPGDSDIPGMIQLWDSIDRLEHTINVSEGKVAATPEDEIISDTYRLYKMRHNLAEMRRDQYLLKDLFKPSIRFLNVQPPSPQFINWDSDSFYWISREEWQRRVNSSLLKISKDPKDYEWNGDQVKWYVRRHTFDWENYQHIRALIDNYSAVWQMAWDDPYSDARILIMDFDRYQDLAELPPLRQHILTRKIDKWRYSDILRELREEWGVVYNENHLSVIISQEIPQRIAKAIKEDRLIRTTPEEDKKICSVCKRKLPADAIFFSHNIGRKDGFSASCKSCEKIKRIQRGGQTNGDRRFKEANLPKM